MATSLSFSFHAIFVFHVVFAAIHLLCLNPHWLVTAIVTAIPGNIQVCKRNDPNLDQCILNAIEELRPRLAKGIPEYDIPPLEPIYLEKIDVSNAGPLKATGTDVYIRGASKFEIKELKADIENLALEVSISIPFLSFEANYEVDAKLLNLNIKGKGPLTANTTDIDGRAILKGHEETKDGKTHIIFDSLDLKLNLKNYNIRLENLFNGDKALNDAVNVAINENKKELVNNLRPQAEKVVSQVLLDRANKITKHFTFDELFPES